MKNLFYCFCIAFFLLSGISTVSAQDTTAGKNISPAAQQANINAQQSLKNGNPVISNGQQALNNGQAPVNGLEVPLHSPLHNETSKQPAADTTIKDSTASPLNANQTSPNGKQPRPHK